MSCGEYFQPCEKACMELWLVWNSGLMRRSTAKTFTIHFGVVSVRR